MINCPRSGGVLLYGTHCVGCDCHLAGFAGRGLVDDPPPDLGRFNCAGDYIHPELGKISQPKADGSFYTPSGRVKGRITGFDLASGPDKTATVRMHRVSDRYEYSVEDIIAATNPRTERMMAEQAEMIRRQRESMEEAIFGAFVWKAAMDGRSRPTHTWGAPPHRNAIEIITDPADRRGMDAKRVRRSRA